MMLAVRAPAFLPTWLLALLFENHYAVWIGVLALGAVLIFLARSRGNPRVLRAGQVVLGVALVWFVGARVLTTPAERLRAAHVGLADAVAQNNVDLILGYFKPEFSAQAGPVQILSGMPTAAAKEQIADSLKEYGIKETIIRAYKVTLNPDGTATTDFTAFTQAAQPLLTTWEVFWEDVPGQDWRIANATLVKIGDQTIQPGDFSDHLP
jgi:hypothetical protein